MTKEELALELTKLVSDSVIKLEYNTKPPEIVNYAEAITEAYNNIYANILCDKE